MFLKDEKFLIRHPVIFIKNDSICKTQTPIAMLSRSFIGLQKQHNGRLQIHQFSNPFENGVRESSKSKKDLSFIHN